MTTICKSNQWVTHGIGIAIQVTFIFAFLTIFFFAYVQEVEKEEFKGQLNLIVDSLMKDITTDLPELINNQQQLNQEDILVITNGIIDILQEKISMESISTVKDVEDTNRKVKMRALKSLSVFIVCVIIIAITTLLFGFCIDITYQIKEAMLVVLFVGLTELVFLQVIAKNYISASPNKVKRGIAAEVQNWIKKNHKI
jgi:hypothetical protein